MSRPQEIIDFAGNDLNKQKELFGKICLVTGTVQLMKTWICS